MARQQDARQPGGTLCSRSEWTGPSFVCDGENVLLVVVRLLADVPGRRPSYLNPTKRKIERHAFALNTLGRDLTVPW